MRILVADDHWMIRASLKQAVNKIDPEIQVVEACTFSEALELLNVHSDIELTFIDLIMPGHSEFEGLRSLRAQHPTVPVVIISVYDDREHLLQAVSEGVIGYIPKSIDAPEMLTALTTILRGGVYFPRDILQGLRAPSNLLPEDSANATALTARETQVLSLLGGGASNPEIAEKLEMSPNTVRVHIRNLGMKLNLRERSELSAYGLAHMPREVP